MQEYFVKPRRLFKDLIRNGRTMTAFRDSFWVEDAGASWYEGPFVHTIWRRRAEGE